MTNTDSGPGTTGPRPGRATLLSSCGLELLAVCLDRGVQQESGAAAVNNVVRCWAASSLSSEAQYIGFRPLVFAFLWCSWSVKCACRDI
jgi:hypothetical protein